jgi:exosome complex component RRP41
LEILELAGLRNDGRKALEIRPVSVNFTIDSSRDGSIFYQQGQNRVLVSIDGPSESRQRQIPNLHLQGHVSINYKEAPYSGLVRRDFEIGKRKSEDIQHFLEETFSSNILLENYPNSHIQISVFVLQHQGSSLSCVINAITTALIHANIAQKSVITSCVCGVVQDRFVLDMNEFEEKLSKYNVVLTASILGGEEATLQVPSSEADIEEEGNEVDRTMRLLEVSGLAIHDPLVMREEEEISEDQENETYEDSVKRIPHILVSTRAVGRGSLDIIAKANRFALIGCQRMRNILVEKFTEYASEMIGMRR